MNLFTGPKQTNEPVNQSGICLMKNNPSTRNNRSYNVLPVVLTVAAVHTVYVKIHITAGTLSRLTETNALMYPSPDE